MAFENANQDLILGDPNGAHIEILSSEAKIVLYNEFNTPIMAFDGTAMFLGETFSAITIRNKEGDRKIQIDPFQVSLESLPALGHRVRLTPGETDTQFPKLEIEPKPIAGVRLDEAHVYGTSDAVNGSGALEFLSPTVVGKEAAHMSLSAESDVAGPRLELGNTDLSLGGSLVGKWLPYTPIWTAFGLSPALNDGSLTAQYTRVGKSVIYSGRLTIGAATAFGTGGWLMSLPVPTAVGKAFFGVGAVMLYDASTEATRTVGACWHSNTTSIRFNCPGGDVRGDTSVPFTWAVGDQMRWSFVYEGV